MVAIVTSDHVGAGNDNSANGKLPVRILRSHQNSISECGMRSSRFAFEARLAFRACGVRFSRVDFLLP